MRYSSPRPRRTDPHRQAATATHQPSGWAISAP